MTSEVLWFADAACRDVGRGGGKGASLAAMTAEGLPVPPGFVVPADVPEASVQAARLVELAHAGDHEGAEALVREAEAPRQAIAEAYAALGGGPVAVRSSACAEDSEAASYAGQQESYLNVVGAEEVCRRVV